MKLYHLPKALLICRMYPNTDSFFFEWAQETYKKPPIIFDILIHNYPTVVIGHEKYGYQLIAEKILKRNLC